MWKWHRLRWEGAKVYFPTNSLLRNSITLHLHSSKFNSPHEIAIQLAKASLTLAHLQLLCAHSYALYSYVYIRDMRDDTGAHNARGHVGLAITMQQTPFGLRFTSRVIILLFLSLLQVSPPPSLPSQPTRANYHSRPLLHWLRVCIRDGCQSTV